MLAAHFDVDSISYEVDAQGRYLTVLGFAIQYYKGKDISFVQKLIRANGNANNIVCRPRRPESSGIWALESLTGYHGPQVWPQETALLVAIRTRSKQMVELLLDEGAEISQPARRGLKRTALQLTCEIGSFEMVQLLLDKGTEVDEPPAERGGATALQLAAISGSIKIAALLLERGGSNSVGLVHADPAMMNGRKALEGAAEHGRLDMTGLLWKAGYGGFKDEEVQKAIKLAKDKGHEGCVDYITDLSSSHHYSGLEDTTS